MLLCDNQAYYTGYAVDLIARYRAHVAGKAAKYTKSFRPLYMAAVWPIYTTKADAMRIERWIKQLSRQEKEALIQNPSQLSCMALE